MSPDVQWKAVMSRDARFDGAFVYGVRSTGIYCRPSCPSRRPAAKQVSYFDRPADAEQKGFRACLRCRPREARLRDATIRTVVRACRLIESSGNGTTLPALARATGVSPAQLRRSFDRIVGVSPTTYAEAFRMDRMKTLLRDGESITGALYEAGYSSPSRVYEDSSRRLGMTPGDYRNRGAAVAISYATVETSLGWLLVAATDRGVCAVRLGNAPGALIRELKSEFDAAAIEENRNPVARYLAALREHLENHAPTPELPLDVQATAFQARVWDVLRKIPYGETRSYTEVANAIGQPSAVRAVARACATNPAALVIPCHRVVRENGELGGYRWGIERKAELLDREKKI
jgi:AraC family transcriptional regulator of adaptative response/methylated-DNA-[protein]-cysteine methyltransferase